MPGMTEPPRKHKDTQQAGPCMATTDHKVRRAGAVRLAEAASARRAYSERRCLGDDSCRGGRLLVPDPTSSGGG